MTNLSLALGLFAKTNPGCFSEAEELVNIVQNDGLGSQRAIDRYGEEGCEQLIEALAEGNTETNSKSCEVRFYSREQDRLRAQTIYSKNHAETEPFMSEGKRSFGLVIRHR